MLCVSRGHTLAYVPSSGRLYAFGLGGSGQLGVSLTVNKNSPALVSWPFVPGLGFGGDTGMQVDSQGPELCVKSISAGGDHSFVLAQDAQVRRSIE